MVLFMAINNTGSRRLLVTLTALLQRFAGCIYSLAEAGWSRLRLLVLPYRWPCDARRRLDAVRSKRAALWLYAALLLGTMIWASGKLVSTSGR